MRISDKTKYSTFASVEPFVTPASIAAIKKAAERVHGNMYDLTFAQFYACMNGDFSHVVENKNDPTVLQVYWIKRFGEFANEFAKTLQSLTIPQTLDEVRASSVLLKVEWGEAMLVFLQSFFHLQSFKQAEQITIGELLIAKRAQYNQTKYERELTKIQRQKMKRK